MTGRGPLSKFPARRAKPAVRIRAIALNQHANPATTASSIPTEHRPGNGPRLVWSYSRGHQCDLVLDGAGAAADQVGAHVPEQPGHRSVVLGDQRGEPADAF